MGKHTPGPWAETNDSDWSVDTDGSNTFIHIGPLGQDPVAIAVVDAAWGKDELLDANARLIAAAPELLEILRTVIFGDPNGNFQFMMAGNPNAQDKFLAEANALLSRIEGDA